MQWVETGEDNQTVYVNLRILLFCRWIVKICICSRVRRGGGYGDRGRKLGRKTTTCLCHEYALCLMLFPPLYLCEISSTIDITLNFWVICDCYISSTTPTGRTGVGDGSCRNKCNVIRLHIPFIDQFPLTLCIYYIRGNCQRDVFTDPAALMQLFRNKFVLHFSS